MDELERVMVLNEEDEHENQTILSTLTIIKMYRITDFLLIFVHCYIFVHSIQVCLTCESQVCSHEHVVTKSEKLRAVPIANQNLTEENSSPVYFVTFFICFQDRNNK